MSTNCISSATILRCTALERGQNGVIFIPAVIQVMAIGGLSLRFWSFSSRKHYWLIADSWAFFVLTLLDLLSHEIYSARISVRVFKVFDIIIGALSFVPILLYMFFIYVLVRSYCLPLLPRLTRKISKYALLVPIPVTIATNELGSFVGVNYRVLRDFNQQVQLAFRFSNRDVLLFFTSVTLVVLIIFQVVIFCFSFYLVLRLILESRGSADTSRNSLSSVEIQMPRLGGISWIAVGAKVGAVETLLGFVDGGFPVVLVRRILRLLSRVCLVYGVLKADSPRSLGRERSMTQIRGLISNPRESTFARLSPTATGFYGQPRANVLYGPRPMPQGGQTEAQDTDTRRVTVSYDGLAPPALNLRLSSLGLPSPEVLTERFNKRGTMLPSREGSKMSAGSSSASLTLSAVAPARRSSTSGLPRELEPVARVRAMSEGESIGKNVPRSMSPRPNPKFVGQDWENGRNPILQHSRFMSASSLASDSLSIVQELASQFPGIPPRQTLSGRYQSTYGERKPSVPALDQVEEEALSRKSSFKSGLGHTQSQTLTPSNSLKRKAPPPILDVQFTNPFEPTQKTEDPLDRSDSKKSENSNKSQSSSMKRKNAPPPIDPVIAQADADGDLSRRVRVRTDSDRNTVYDNTQARSATPGMSFGAGSSRVTSPRTPPANPFRDGSSDFIIRDSDLLVQGGLRNIAARVAEYDRQMMASYRGVPDNSPPIGDSYSGTSEGKDRKGKNPIRMPPVAFPLRDSTSVPISSPRRLSASTPRSRTSSGNTMVADTAVESVRREQWKGGNITRIKSIGQVSSRRTPTPTPSTSSFTRQSMRVDEADFLDLSNRRSAVLVKPRPGERRMSLVAAVENTASTPRKLKKVDKTIRDAGDATYNRPYLERRTRRESEGEWEM